MDGCNIACMQTEGKFRGTREIIYVVVIDGFSQIESDLDL